MFTCDITGTYIYIYNCMLSSKEDLVLVPVEALGVGGGNAADPLRRGRVALNMSLSGYSIYTAIYLYIYIYVST